MIKTKKQMFITIGVFTLVLMLGTVTYAFFNYTRTGSRNIIKTGRISFSTEQNGTLNLTNINMSGFNFGTSTSFSLNSSGSLTNLEVINLKNANMHNLGQSYFMFSNCTSLTIVDLSGLTIPSTAQLNGMFSGCTSLVGGAGTTYDANYVDKTYARVGESGMPGYMTWIN